MKTPKRNFVLQNSESEYYTVFGWSASTTKKVSSAVIFPNDTLRMPEGKWKRIPVTIGDCGFAKLKP